MTSEARLGLELRWVILSPGSEPGCALPQLTAMLLLQSQALLLEAGAEGASRLGLQRTELSSEFSAIPVDTMGPARPCLPLCGEQVPSAPADPSFSHWVKSEVTAFAHRKARLPTERQAGLVAARSALCGEHPPEPPLC